ncbi:MAG TPA: hypothetical protein VFU41_08230 [Gemmatimonadales bacterium]|nr:hypothetical protein [Gemmatimonadales bacterium]
MAILLLAALVCVGAGAASAQATGTTTFNAPYRAFQRSEIGLLLSFPDGGGTAVEGAYRMASGKFDLGFKAGFLDPDGPGDVIVLLGAEARQRVITHTVDFPLDGALILGVGGNFVSNNSAFVVPVGLSLGRRVDPQGSTVSIVPYVQPTLFLLAGNNVADHVQFSLGLGADFRLSRAFDARLSAGLGDNEGVSIGAVWVH